MDQIPSAYAALAEDGDLGLLHQAPEEEDDDDDDDDDDTFEPVEARTLWDFFRRTCLGRHTGASHRFRRWRLWMSPAAALGLAPGDRTINPTERTLLLPRALLNNAAVGAALPGAPPIEWGAARHAWASSSDPVYEGLGAAAMDLVQGRTEWSDSMVRQHILPARLPVSRPGPFRIYAQLLDGTSVLVEHSGGSTRLATAPLDPVSQPGALGGRSWTVDEVVRVPDGEVWILEETVF